MKKNILIPFAIFTAIGFGFLIFNACSKNDNIDNVQSVHFSESDLLKINNFVPEKESMSNIYYSFRNEIASVKNPELKATIEPIDRSATEAAWLLDATTNTELGFKNDSIEELFIDTLSLTFINKSFNSEDIPIIDGDDLVSAYLQFENKTFQDLIYDELLWATKTEITEITEGTTTINLISAGGPKGNGKIIPLPPGVDPPAYPAGSPPLNMFDYAIHNWARIAADGFFIPGPNYIWYYVGSQFQSWYNNGPPNGFDERIAHSMGYCQSSIISGELLNDFLFSEKEVIDEHNPIGLNGYFIGYFQINCFNFPYPQLGNINSEHILHQEIWVSVYIGDPDK